MLDVIGVASIDELVDQTIPPGIRLGRELDLGEPRGESELLSELAEMASRNRVMKSYLGTGYHDCVVPPVIRTPVVTTGGTAGSCDGFPTLDLNALWCPTCPKPQKNPGAGSLLQAQFWYRDPLSTSNQTTSLTNAIEFQVCP